MLTKWPLIVHFGFAGVAWCVGYWSGKNWGYREIALRPYSLTLEEKQFLRRALKNLKNSEESPKSIH